MDEYARRKAAILCEQNVIHMQYQIHSIYLFAT